MTTKSAITKMREWLEMVQAGPIGGPSGKHLFSRMYLHAIIHSLAKARALEAEEMAQQSKDCGHMDFDDYFASLPKDMQERVKKKVMEMAQKQYPDTHLHTWDEVQDILKKEKQEAPALVSALKDLISEYKDEDSRAEGYLWADKVVEELEEIISHHTVGKV